MEPNTQTSQDIEIYAKKKITIKTVLNIYGYFTVFGLIISIFTTPVSINENMQFYYNEEFMMGEKKTKEFLLFIFCSAIVYLFILNINYKYLDKK